LHHTVKVLQEVNIIDFLFVAEGIPNFLPDFLVVVFKLIEFDTKIHHSSLVVLALIIPLGKYDIFLE